MKLGKALDICSRMIKAKGNFDTVILEGDSGIGKTSALFSTICSSMEELVANENGVSNVDESFRKKYGQEILDRIIVTSMGGTEDATRFLGMSVPYEGKLRFMRPEEFETLRYNDGKQRVLLLDETNRVDPLTSNGVQPYLGASDRRIKGLHNVSVFGTQNPAEDRFIGTHLQDEAFNRRTVIFHIDNPTMDDLVYVSQLRRWHESIIDGLEFLLEDNRTVNAEAVPVPRILENISNFVNSGIIEEEFFQAALPKHPQIGKVLYDSACGTLFKVMTPEEMLDAVTNKQTTKLVQFMASFRKAINGLSGAPTSEQNRVYDLLGKVSLGVPATYLAAIHKRFSGNINLAMRWAQNKELTNRVNNIRGGLL